MYFIFYKMFFVVEYDFDKDELNEVLETHSYREALETYNELEDHCPRTSDSWKKIYSVPEDYSVISYYENSLPGEGYGAPEEDYGFFWIADNAKELLSSKT